MTSMAVDKQDNKPNDQPKDIKKKKYDDDIPVCICGKPYVVLKVSECYDGTGVGCDECGKNIEMTANVYHCPADKNNILHTSGYDVCIPCYNKLSDQVNIDNTLFKIWFIINSLNKELYTILAEEYEITSTKSLISKSSYDIFKFVTAINWNKYGPTTSQLFYDKYDELRKTLLSLKKSAYKFKPNQQQQQQQIQQRHSYNNYYNNYQPQSSSHSHHLNSNANSFSRANKSVNYNNNNNAVNYNQSAKSRSRMKMKSAAPPMRNSMRRSMPSMARSMNAQNMVHMSYGGSYSMQSQQCAMPSMNTSMAFSNDMLSNDNNNNIGFSVGGAKDISTFRLNIEKHQMPQIKAISYQGIFYDYYFDTNPITNDNDNDDNKQTNDIDMMTNQPGSTANDDDNKQQDLPIFYPSYSCAKSVVPRALLMTTNKKVTNDMLDDDDDDYNTKEYEFFLTVGLNSNISEKDFRRKKLNLVIVLDISGSMSSSFDSNSFYGDHTKSKMKVANECLLLLLTHLNSDDRFGLVLFNNYATTKIKMDLMSNLKMKQIEDILEIRASGGTNMSTGYKAGVNMFGDIIVSTEYEHRIVFLTDAHPNSGQTSPGSLLSLVKEAANRPNNRIYTTFVGIGLDFNADLISQITDVRGSNYFAVHSNKEFKKKLYTEFEYFVSPMVFDLVLTLFCEGSKEGCISEVYGSDNIDIQNGEIMKIKTLFPSPPNDDGDIKGGIVLIKIKKENIAKNLKYFVQVTCEDKFGKKIDNKQKVILNPGNNMIDNEFYPNNGVRKGLLLTRYVKLCKYWIGNRSTHNQNEYKNIFQIFKKYFENEMKYIKDATLKQEIKIINKLIAW